MASTLTHDDARNRYWLHRQVHICVSGSAVVFLDARTDRYFALPVTVAAGLTTMVVNWPSLTDLGLPVSYSTSNTAGLIANLLERGILVSAEALGKPATPVCAQSPRQAAGCDYWEGNLSVSAGNVFNMIRAWLIASYFLHCRPIDRMFDRVRSCSGRHNDEPADALRLTTIFNRLRPFFYKSTDVCLFNSMVLAEFLRAYRIYPHWVFGVHADPWAAHCWLQIGDVALNDRNEEAQGLAPIMMI